MSLDKFEQPTKRILSSENLRNFQSIADNRYLIDKNLLDESQKFISVAPQSVNVKERKMESTEEIDNRVRKFNEIDERLKKYTKNMKKQLRQTDKQCDLHRKVEMNELLAVGVNEFIEKDFPVVDIDSVLKADEVYLQQHESNIEKMNKLMNTVNGYKHDEATLPAAVEVNESIMVLCEVITFFETR